MKRLSELSMRLRSEIRSSVTLPGRSRIGSLVVALSGGLDSVALLHLLVSLREELELQLTAAHFDHRLRAEAAEDAEFAGELSRELRCRFVLEAAKDSPGLQNLEAWARERRYAFLETVRAAANADIVCTAHHRDDQAETLLLRLLSGRLATKSYGIAEFDERRKLLRPLLRISRKELESYVEEHGLRYVVDSSNADPDRTRNRVRRELLPQLEAGFNPNLRETLGELSSRMAADEDVLWQLAEELAVTWEQSWSASRFASAEPALRWRSLGILAQRSGLERVCGYRKLRLLEDQILKCRGESFELDLGSGVRAQYGPGKGLAFTVYRHGKSSQTPETIRSFGSIDTQESQLRYSSGELPDRVSREREKTEGIF